MSPKTKAEEKLELIIEDLKSSDNLNKKRAKKALTKKEFIDLAREVKRIFEEEERDRRFSNGI